jgi:predicted aminopeptidase
MKEPSRKPGVGRIGRLLAALALGVVVTALCGCRTLSFYGQACKGQYELLARARPIPKLLADPQTPGELKERLRLLLRLRVFAQQSLKLPVDGQYQKYADVRRRFVVWNVEAAPEFSLQPKTWWYPLVGCLEYRGYFSERGADNYGSWLERKGWDVYVGGAQAYSTLGWFKDPALSTFLFEPDGDLAEVVFHELAHKRVFASGDTDFNEAFATTVGQEGARRWLQARGTTAQFAAYEAELRRAAQFARLIMETRAQLAALYGDERDPWGKLVATRKQRDAAPRQLRREKQRILERLKQAYSGLKASWGGDTEYDAWFSRQVNNAKLNSVAAYYDLVPCFQELLERNGSDLERFYQAAERLARMPDPQRRQSLRLLAPGAPPNYNKGREARLVRAASDN